MSSNTQDIVKYVPESFSESYNHSIERCGRYRRDDSQCITLTTLQLRYICNRDNFDNCNNRVKYQK